MSEADQWKLMAIAWVLLWADLAKDIGSWREICTEQNDLLKGQQELIAELAKENKELHADWMERNQ